MFDRVEMRQQRFIQRLHRLRIGKINGLLTQRIERNVALQVRMGLGRARAGRSVDGGGYAGVTPVSGLS